MKMRNIKEWFDQWDTDLFDLTAMTAGEMHPAEQKTEAPPPSAKPIRRIEEKEKALFRKSYPVLSFVLGTVMTVFLILAAFDLPAYGSADVPANNEVVSRYAGDGLQETGAVNLVAGIILDYRAFDTLGESHVLFTALYAVLILLLAEKDAHLTQKGPEGRMRRDGIVMSTAAFLVPIIILFGIYIILNGHLGPGGGFAGGSVIGAGLILYAVAFGFTGIERIINGKTFRTISVCALCFYSLSKCYSFFCGANGYHTVFTPGEPGRILSAGLILPLNIAVGVVVACTMYGLYSVFERGEI